MAAEAESRSEQEGHRIFRRRAKHPVVFGLVDLTISGGEMTLAATNTAYNFLMYSHNLQAAHGMEFTPAPSPNTNTELYASAAVTAALYLVYYFSNVRALNPKTWFEGARRGISAMRNRSRRQS